ncbi:hypothetical protein [Listeria innocua]|uniref:hypothetical protein n=1 Tax=Listeria innocua TaxID=1642 RepID=UPI00226F97FD|nr:hypothetical protein [Listeria innocua]
MTTHYEYVTGLIKNAKHLGDLEDSSFWVRHGEIIEVLAEHNPIWRKEIQHTYFLYPHELESVRGMFIELEAAEDTDEFPVIASKISNIIYMDRGRDNRMKNNYMFKEIEEKEQEIKKQLEQWKNRGIRSAGIESRNIAELFTELANLERLSDLKIMESEA